MAHVYRLMDAGEIDPGDGTKRAYVLTGIAKVLEASEIEARIDALEERQAAGRPLLPNYAEGAH